MQDEAKVLETLEGAKSLISQIPNVTYGANIMSYLNIEGYGNGQAAFDLLNADFALLDFEKIKNVKNLNASINKKKKELTELEQKHSLLEAIFGKDDEVNKGTLAKKLVETIDEEVRNLIARRDALLKEVDEAETAAKSKLEHLELVVAGHDDDAKKKTGVIDQRVTDAEASANDKIREVVSKASNKVRIIEQFSDFLAETNSNMQIYFWVLFFLVLGAGLAVAFSIPDLIKCYEGYESFVKSLGTKVTSYQIINYAFGILIVKLPWALCLSAVFTGLYSLIKGVLITYEKINQDKRNISAIYAVSGSIAQTLNEYGLSITTYEENDETGQLEKIIVIKPSEIIQKRESLKWNQIMNYFEGMQQQKAEVIIPEEDNSSLKFATEIANKLIDKIPTGT